MDMVLGRHLFGLASIPCPCESVTNAVKIQRFRNRNIVYDIDSHQFRLNRKDYGRRFGLHQERELEISLFCHAKVSAYCIQLIDSKLFGHFSSAAYGLGFLAALKPVLKHVADAAFSSSRPCKFQCFLIVECHDFHFCHICIELGSIELFLSLLLRLFA